MPNKTIYVKSEDVHVWEEVQSLHDGQIGVVLIKLLREYLKTAKADKIRHLEKQIEALRNGTP